MATGRIFISNPILNDRIYTVTVYCVSGDLKYDVGDKLVLSNGTMFKVVSAPDVPINNATINIEPVKLGPVPTLDEGWYFIVGTTSKNKLGFSKSLSQIDNNVKNYLIFLNDNMEILDSLLNDSEFLSKLGEDGEGNPTWDGQPWPGNVDIATLFPNKAVLDTITQEHLDNSHTHANEDVLAKVGENVDGDPTWDGLPWPSSFDSSTINTLFVKDTDPTVDQGINGDLYINNSNWNVWLKESDIWVSKGSLSPDWDDLTLPEAIQKIGQDGEGNPTWDGAEWPGNVDIAALFPNKAVLDTITQQNLDDIHTHTNKAVLDTYTQTEANLADAVAKKHEHTNTVILDKLGEDGEGNPTWDGAEWPGNIELASTPVEYYTLYLNRDTGTDRLVLDPICTLPTSWTFDNSENRSTFKIVHNENKLLVFGAYNVVDVPLAAPNNEVGMGYIALYDGVDGQPSGKNIPTGSGTLYDATRYDTFKITDFSDDKYVFTFGLVSKEPTIAVGTNPVPGSGGSGGSGDGVTDHTLLTNQNGNINFLHISQTEKTKYDGYEALLTSLQNSLNDALQRIVTLEGGTPVLPVEFGVPTVHNTTNQLINQQLTVDIPLTQSEDHTYIINDTLITTSPSNIKSGSSNIFVDGSNKYLRVLVTPTAYDQLYTLSIGASSVSFDGVGNVQTPAFTFTTEAAGAPIIANSTLNGQTDVAIDDITLTYAVTSPDSGTLSFVNDNVVVNGAIKGTVSYNEGVLSVPLTGLTNETEVTVTIGASTIFNATTPNTQLVTTFTTIAAAALPEPVIANSTLNGQSDVAIDDVVLTYAVTGTDLSLAADNVTVTGAIKGTVTFNAGVLSVPLTGLTNGSTVSVTVGVGTMSNGGTVNSTPVVTTFTTVAATPTEPVIANSTLNGQTGVAIDDVTLTYAVTGANLSLAADNVTVTGATKGTVTFNAGVLSVPLTGLAYETEVTVTIGAGTMSNGGTVNSTPVVTTFTTIEEGGIVSPYEWEYTYHIPSGTFRFKPNTAVSPTWDPAHAFTNEDIYGPLYDGANKTVELLWFGYTGNILHPYGAPMAMKDVETWNHLSPDGKVSWDEVDLGFAGGTAGIRLYKLVKHKVPITRTSGNALLENGQQS